MAMRSILKGEEKLAAPTHGVSDWLRLAAAPTFALMAFATGITDATPSDLFCTAAHNTSPLNGMALMYLLMSAFHGAPWLQLFHGQRTAQQI
jgi:hypothetical protein